jgi:hypothetical protein
LKKLFFYPLLCVAIFSCNSNLNNLNEESFYGSWSSHVQYSESISTDIVFSVDSITDLIFLQEMTLIQYEIDENDQRMPSSDFVDRSTPDRDIIKQKVEEILEANNNIVGSWSSDPDEIYEFKSESGQNKMIFEQTSGEFDYRLFDMELPQAGKKLQFYAPTGWTDFQDNKYLLIKSVRKNNRISMESETTKRYNFRMNTGLGATGPFDISGVKSKTLICNFELRAL